MAEDTSINRYPLKKVHSGLHVQAPFNLHKITGRLLEARNLTKLLLDTAYTEHERSKKYSTSIYTSMALFNMAGDIFVVLERSSNSENMRIAYRQAANTCYDNADVVRRSSYTEHKITPTVINGLGFLV